MLLPCGVRRFWPLKWSRDVTGVSRSGRLSKDGFVAALFLIYRAHAGLEIPETLPEFFATAFSIPQSDPFSNSDQGASLSSPDEEDEVGGLYAQIRALQDALVTLSRENEDLQSSVQTWTRLSRQQSMSHNRMSRSVDTNLAEITRLQAELQEKDNTISRLRASERVIEDLSRENTMFRLQVEELTSRLQVSDGEAMAQKLLADELSRESERLKQQLDGFRESSTHVPTVTGDDELQTLINEDLSRENHRLRNQMRELNNSLSELQAPNDEMVALKESTRALTRENKRLQRRLREMESSNAAASSSGSQDEQRRRVGELSRENERLRRDLEQARRRPARQDTTDAPPPAYEEVGQ
ncbi:hypothetical protein BT96DRAFT_852147 [Gymnopus androsaceus JB14]|uniref:EH domain-containing protein n=1 Tax=Gymnopus androsaceus JB14 TaxID=1447944 RepID=A0A6A4I5W3_9AGAR|nr:hypothetical protein BT96DRAFT_852147 [Gymnopus androsaceus JB14]